MSRGAQAKGFLVDLSKGTPVELAAASWVEDPGTADDLATLLEDAATYLRKAWRQGVRA